MVFEGILVDVLNRFLGPYVKNLDASQLKVGIWGGAHYLEYPSHVELYSILISYSYNLYMQVMYC